MNRFKTFMTVAGASGVGVAAMVLLTNTAGAQVTTSTVGSDIDLMANVWQDFFQVLLNHLFGTIVGIVILITVWYLIRRYVRSLA